jgi:hypothetical protein
LAFLLSKSPLFRLLVLLRSEFHLDLLCLPLEDHRPLAVPHHHGLQSLPHNLPLETLLYKAGPRLATQADWDA